MGNLGTWLANIIEHPAFTLFGILFGGVFGASSMRNYCNLPRWVQSQSYFRVNSRVLGFERMQMFP